MLEFLENVRIARNSRKSDKKNELYIYYVYVLYMYLLYVSIRYLKYFCVLFVLFVFLFMLLASLRCYTSIYDGFIVFNNYFHILLCTWVGVEVKVKTLTMESKTTTIRSLRRRTHLTWEFYSVVVFGVEGYLSRELKLNNYLLFEIIPNTDFVARIPGQWVLRKPRFFSWK